MLLRNICNELREIRKIDINRANIEDVKFYNNFIYNTDREMYNRRLCSIQKFAKMIDVPIGFIVGVLKIERIEDSDFK